MNVILLEKIKAQILLEPHRLNMATWISLQTPRDCEEIDNYATLGDYKKDRAAFDKENVCDTAACIAGWACLIAGNVSPSKFIVDEAEELLWLTASQAIHLFHVDSWPSKFREKYQDLDHISGATRERRLLQATITAERIDYFIKTGGL